MLRYCGWCGKYLGANRAAGYQVTANLCAIDTTGICPACMSHMLSPLSPSTEDKDNPPDHATFRNTH